MGILPCRLIKSFTNATILLYRFLSLRLHPFCIQLCYFLSLSAVGFLLLKTIQPKRKAAAGDLDVFFTSVSAVTVSSMSTIEMEYFSNAQLVVLTVLMLVGAEAITSMLGLQLRNVEQLDEETSRKVVEEHRPAAASPSEQIELGLMAVPEVCMLSPAMAAADHEGLIKTRAVRCLVLVVLGCTVVINVLGSTLVLLYLVAFPSAKDVLRGKNIQLVTFSVFTVVSSFSNCGFIPTNENMIIFRKHSGLLLLVAAVVLAGNTLHPLLLRSAIWALGRVTRRPGAAEVFEYLLKNHGVMAYDHLLSARRCAFLGLTVAGLLLVQLVLFCCMEWGSAGLEGMNTYQKLVGGLFMSVNSRHAGESVVDISSVSSAVLVLFVIMMYLPPYTTFMPLEYDHEAKTVSDHKEGKRRKSLMKSLIFSQLSYIAIFTILICITERKKLSRDPLNFNVLNIVIEVVSAHGNVGFSTGYSCARRLESEGYCSDMWNGFSGRWSSEGKLVLICVMLFGRLKRLSMHNGGKAWVLG